MRLFSSENLKEIAEELHKTPHKALILYQSDSYLTNQLFICYINKNREFAQHPHIFENLETLKTEIEKCGRESNPISKK